MMSSITDLLNSQSTNNREYKKIRLETIDIEDIISNTNNKFPLSEMIELQNSIKEKGLLNPPTVYANEDGSYTLVSGHRRLTAIRPMIDSGEMSPEIKCIVIPAPKDGVSEIESIYIANKNRPPLTEEQLKVCVEQLIETWNNKSDEEKRGRMRDYIATHLNISARSLQKYINEYNALHNPNKTVDNTEIESDEQEQKKKQDKKKKKIVQKLIKNSTLCEELEDVMDIYHNQITYQDKQLSVNEALLMIQDLSNQIATTMKEQLE